MTKPSKGRVRRERTVHIHAELWQASGNALSIGRDLLRAENNAAKWQFLACSITTAFAFEAYLNHIGSQVLNCWSNGLEKLAPLGKLAIISEKLSLQLSFDSSVRPMQTLQNLIKFRNTMAHGRTEVLPPREDIVDVNANFYSLIVEPVLTDWENLLRNEKFCVQARKDVCMMMKAIHKVQTVDSAPLFASGRHRGSGELLGDV